MRILMMLVLSMFLFVTNVSAASADPPDLGPLTGEWAGTWTSLNSPSYNGTVELNVTQDGNKVSGTSVMGNAKCFPDRIFKGKVSGIGNNVIKLKLFAEDDPGTQVAKTWGVINRCQNAISAVYKFTTEGSGKCQYDVGTMFISKKQPFSPC
ncbi:MAG: hypothetical protein F6J93_30245 [Oscillatoria sp. SIO1A7]|nr:hypothetical protein [Oscillatoria sp. SIO1A7]